MLSLCLSGLIITQAAAADLSSATIVKRGADLWRRRHLLAFEYQKDGKLTGFDIDMIGALSKKLAAEGSQ